MSKETERIAQAVAQQVGVRGDGTYRIIRATLDGGANVYKLVATLPEDCVVWRIKNTDPETLVRFSLDNESPTATANDDKSSLQDLEPEEVDTPLAVPALIGRAIRVYAARTGTATQPVLEIIYTTSKNARIMVAVVTGTPPAQLGGTTKASLSGLYVNIIGGVNVSGSAVLVSGQAVRISGETVTVAGGVSVSGNVVQISGQGVTTSVSGNIIQISGQSVGTSVSGNVVQVSGQTVYLAEDTSLGLVYSGVLSFGSGATSGTIATVSIAPPTTRPAGASYLLDVYPNVNLSSDVRVFVNRIMSFNSNLRRTQLATFLVEKAASGESSVFEGLFVGGTTGEILLRIETAAVENISSELVLWRMG